LSVNESSDAAVTWKRATEACEALAEDYGGEAIDTVSFVFA
jgi:hypothetical protein